jgi:probable phosphomutase (TIGR03848 family)
MTTIMLVRHAVNDFVKTGKLAGWTPGVHLNEDGLAQAEALGQRLTDVEINRLLASPLDRTIETAEAIRKYHPHLEIELNQELAEVRYGDWEGAKISDLQRRKMWEVVQEYPSRAYFPNGETMRSVQVRAVNEIERLVQQYPGELVVIVGHADIIKMVLAHYLGMHLDNFQRIVVSPASISTMMIGHGRPFVVTMNDVAHVWQMERDRKREQAGTPEVSAG